MKIRCCENSNDGKANSNLIIFIVILGIIFFMQISSTNFGGCQDTAVQTSTEQKTENEQASTSVSSEQTNQSPTATASDTNQPEVIIKPSRVVFTEYSTGYDWKRADAQTKRQFCQTVANAESKEFNHDFTADFYYNALDSFYDSSDSSILGENIHKVIGMTTSVAIGDQ